MTKGGCTWRKFDNFHCATCLQTRRFFLIDDVYVCEGCRKKLHLNPDA